MGSAYWSHFQQIGRICVLQRPGKDQSPPSCTMLAIRARGETRAGPVLWSLNGTQYAGLLAGCTCRSDTGGSSPRSHVQQIHGRQGLDSWCFMPCMWSHIFWKLNPASSFRRICLTYFSCLFESCLEPTMRSDACGRSPAFGDDHISPELGNAKRMPHGIRKFSLRVRSRAPKSRSDSTYGHYWFLGMSSKSSRSLALHLCQAVPRSAQNTFFVVHPHDAFFFTKSGCPFAEVGQLLQAFIQGCWHEFSVAVGLETDDKGCCEDLPNSLARIKLL